MRRPKASLTGIIKAPEPADPIQSHNQVIAQLRDDEVPDASVISLPVEPTPSPVPPKLKGKAKAKPADDDTAGMAHRSLYAKPETLEKIREIAFKERVSAQSLYREGLLLMLQGRGYFEDKTLDDV